MGWFQGVQLVWAVLVIGVAVERAVALLLRLPADASAVAFVSRSLREGDVTAALSWARTRSHTLLGRLVLEALAQPGQDDDPIATWSDLATVPGQRLAALRVAATLSSTLGLLGGVLAIARGLGGHRGLVGLQAGLAESIAMREALLSMALGVGTAAVCFFCLGRLRPAAAQIVAHGRSVAHLIAEARAHDGARNPAL